jgi:hypothetical protein
LIFLKVVLRVIKIDPDIKVDIFKSGSSSNKDRMRQLLDKDIQEKFQQQKSDVEAKIFV